MTPPVSGSLCTKGLWLVKGGGEEFSNHFGCREISTYRKSLLGRPATLLFNSLQNFRRACIFSKACRKAIGEYD